MDNVQVKPVNSCNLTFDTNSCRIDTYHTTSIPGIETLSTGSTCTRHANNFCSVVQHVLRQAVNVTRTTRCDDSDFRYAARLAFGCVVIGLRPFNQRHCVSLGWSNQKLYTPLHCWGPLLRQFPGCPVTVDGQLLTASFRSRRCQWRGRQTANDVRGKPVRRYCLWSSETT